jgi:glycine cleavage system H protein
LPAKPEKRAMRFTRDHEYVRVEESLATIGISDHAQQQLGDIVYVELPTLGAKLEKGAAAAVVESVKAASDVYCPVTGEVAAVNDAVQSEPSVINEDAQGRGWLFKLKLANPGDLDALMDEAAYAEFLKTIA